MERLLAKHDSIKYISEILDIRNGQQKRTEILVDNNPVGNNYINEYAKEIEKVTPADIQKAAQKYLTQPSITAISTN